MAVEIDAMGKVCPMPVVLAKQVLAKQVLDGGENDVTVVVDNQIAVENLTRLAESQGMTAVSAPREGGFAVRITGERKAAPAPEPVACCPTAPGGATVFIGKDFIGDGSRELGENLMKMFLYTLAQSEVPPVCLLFMNAGVTLPAGEEAQVIESLQALSGKGCEILVCGTCLNYYGLTERLKVGTVSNMYDIADKLLRASRVVTL